MRKQYDDFIQLKIKDMSKTISDMTYKYLDSERNVPTIVPASHYERLLNQVQETYMGEITSKQFLSIMYNQLNALKKEDEKYFQQALLCLDMGINPKDLRINEQIALSYTYDYISSRQKFEKKEFCILNEDIVDTFNESKNDPSIQSEAVKISNILEDRDNYFGKESSDNRDNIFNRDDR